MANAQFAFTSPLSKERFESQAPLLDAFDKLRQHGAKLDISFPQWVVVGDQNTGKSSVMEAISCIPFPVQSDICTRFPIQLELRGAPESKVEVTIIPSKNEDAQRSAQLQQFKRTSNQFFNLQNLVAQAADEMGISPQGLPNGTAKTRGFSDSILRIHASGPKLPELSIVDLPGLYSSGSQEQDEEGKALVERVVKKFVKQESSIVLLVISARKDYATHSGPALLEGMKQKLSGLQRRTMGVITNPDGANHHEEVLKLMNKKLSGLGIEWHCLKNLSHQERESAAEGVLSDIRDQKEKSFFQKSPWMGIPEEERGIDSLRKRLRDIQAEVIRRQAPRVVSELRKQKEKVQKNLSQMGEPRTTIKEQADYLAEMAQEFRECVENAVRGEYKGRSYFRGLEDTDFDSQIRRFRACIREMNRVFACTMMRRGKTHEIDPFIGVDIDMQRHSAESVDHTRDSHDHTENTLNPADGEPNPAEETTMRRPDSPYSSNDSLSKASSGPSPAELVKAKFEKSHLPEAVLKPYRLIPEPKEIGMKSYRQWLAERAPQWRGEEHPLDVNPALIGLVFEAESLKWEQIAKTHVEQVWAATTRFVDIALDETVPVAGVRGRLRMHLIEERLDLLHEGMVAKLDEVLQVHRTSNTSIFDSFEDLTAGSIEMAASKSKPIGSFLEACLSVTSWTQGWAKQVLPLLISQKGRIGRHAEAVANFVRLGEESNLVTLREIFLGYDDDDDPELRKAWLTTQKCDDYYQKCLPVFVSYVNGLVVEKHLMQKLGKEVFSERVVRRAEGDILEKIVGEDENTVKEWIKYQEQLTQLKECIKRLESRVPLTVDAEI